MLKRCLALGPAIWVLLFGLWIGPKYDRFVLPAFDGHVYDSIAEAPRVFTLAPWGYRILAPWLVHIAPKNSSAEGFFWLNLCLLAGSVYIVGAWLRRLGYSSESAALAASALAISPPMRLLLDYQVLVDPLGLFLFTLILRELVDPDRIVLAALFAASALTKETGLLVLVLVPLALVPRVGVKRGLFDSMVVAAPALALAFLLRVTWGDPHLTWNSYSILDLTLGRILASTRDLALTALLSGLTVLAVVGLFRETSVVLRVSGAVMWVMTFGLILSNPYHYSVADLPRLSVYAWPALLPLALTGIGFKRTPGLVSATRFPRLRQWSSVATLGLCLGLVAITDPYQRLPFEANPDPIAMVGRLRETIKTARALDEGATFVFDARSGRFASPVEQRFNLTDARRQRWFLYNGFGPDAAFGGGAPEFRHNAELLLPLFTPRDVTMTFEVAGTGYIPIFVQHQQVGEVFAGRGPLTVTLPAKNFVRGDNVVRLETYTEDAMRLLRWEVTLQPKP